MQDARILSEKQSFIKNHPNFCEYFMHYDSKSKCWTYRYDPKDCATFCSGKNIFCPVLGRFLDKKKGNVYFDRKYEGILKYPLYEMPWTQLHKGIKVFKKPVSMDICKAYISHHNTEDLNKEFRFNHPSYFFSNGTLKVSILNMRAARKLIRDPIQDLLDQQAGVNVFYEADLQEKALEMKRKKRQEAKTKRIKKMEKVIQQKGYENLTEVEKYRACKLFTMEQIEALQTQEPEVSALELYSLFE